jgi:hypothetical protein
MSNITILKKIFEPEVEHIEAMKKLEQKRTILMEELSKSLQEEDRNHTMKSLFQQRRMLQDITMATDEMIQRQGDQNSKLFWASQQ